MVGITEKPRETRLIKMVTVLLEMYQAKDS